MEGSVTVVVAACANVVLNAPVVTRLPARVMVPVLDTPVPPRAAASVPLLMLLAFSVVRDAPLMAGMFASVVALPTLVTSPVMLALVVTVAALPVNVAASTVPSVLPFVVTLSVPVAGVFR